ncbi:MAG: ABC transporter substrate-binding protein [Candidatus Woesearchaeota archaeon]
MKNKIVAIIAGIALIIALIGLFKVPGEVIEKQSTFDKILEKDEMMVCTMVWPESVIKDPDTGRYSGFIIEILEEIARDADLDVKIIESTWGGFPADLNTGKCDAAIAGIYPTIGRSTSISFTEPFFFAGNSGAVRADDNRFKTINDLNQNDVKIAVIQGEFGHIYAKKYLPKAELLVLDKSSDNSLPLTAVTSGKADVGLIMSDVVDGYVKEHPEVKKVFDGEPYSTTPIAWGVRTEDQELLNFLDNAIAYLKATGFLDATAEKYEPEGWYTLKQEYDALS